MNFRKALEEVSGIRSTSHDDRNKYINATVAATSRAGRQCGGSGAGDSAACLLLRRGGRSRLPGGTNRVKSMPWTKTDQSGGKGGSPFVRGDAENRMMLGVEHDGIVVASRDPAGRSGLRKAGSGAGAGRGEMPGSRITVMAKTGYVVGGMDVVTEDNVEAFQVEFFRCGTAGRIVGMHIAATGRERRATVRRPGAGGARGKKSCIFGEG